MSKCSSKLISIQLDTKLDRLALSRELGLQMHDVYKNRLRFSFHVYQPSTNQTIYEPQLSFEKLYVAGRSQPLMTMYSRAQVVPVINGMIDLTL
jgi:hypothetical protein